MRIRNNDISLHNEERNPAEGIYTPRAKITHFKILNQNQNQKWFSNLHFKTS